MTSFETVAVRENLADDARMGCGICRIVYDLAEGARACA